jgi:hypothetical protein
MKISAIHIENFKQFDNLDIEVRNTLTGDIAKRFLLLGDNGTGKTTVLQAIALTLSMACYFTRSVETFNWIGWLAARYKRWGKPIVELTVHFSPAEILATQEISKRWYDGLHETERQSYVEPADSEIVTLRLQGNYCSTPNKPEEIYQFRGRSYAEHLLKQGDYEASEFFERLPGVFWFDQFRHLATVEENLHEENNNGRISYRLEVSELRQILTTWYLKRLRSPRYDYYGAIEDLYKKMFPDREFSGPEPMYENMPTPSSNYFMLSDGKRAYEIQEMSSGEQAIFPILFQFVRLQIDHSVVLIDEIDLNLHPPLAQALFSTLPQIGPNCQFLYTTHSEVISRVANPNQIYRLAGGKLCL